MFNLSFHGSHNASIAISKDNKILECVEFERLLSKKNAALFFYESPNCPQNYIKEVYEYFKNKYGAIEYEYILANSIKVSDFDISEIIPHQKLYFIPHHICHASSAFYQSPYKKALIISFDGGSDEGFFNIYFGERGKELEKLYSGEMDYAISYMMPAHCIKDIRREEIYTGNLVYSGKLMGYVGYGKVNEDMIEKLEVFYKSNTYDNIVESLDRFVDIFSSYGIRGRMISTNSRLSDEEWIKYSLTYFSEEDGKDIATTNQYVFEKLFLEEITPFLEKYPDIPLVITGGCGLNIINNTSLSKIRELFVPPNPSDVGLAVGMLCDLIKPDEPVDTTYIGSPVWDRQNLSRHIYERPSSEYDYNRLSKEIISGGIIGVVRGGSEHGPRALGNRSILCDATNPKMKDYLNSEIKNREWFRPFSPVVRLEDVNKYFEFDGESRWMTFCPKVRDQYKEMLSSVIHIDGTARVQTVTREQNEFLYDLLTEIDYIRGNAVLLNTSFNVAGKPILNTYEEAFWMLDNKNLCGIVLEDYYFPKVTDGL